MLKELNIHKIHNLQEMEQFLKKYMISVFNQDEKDVTIK